MFLGPDDWMSEPALHSKKPWRAVLARRRWRSGYNAGGGPAYIGMVMLIAQLPFRFVLHTAILYL